MNGTFPTTCTEICDDGIIVGQEICDDNKQFGSNDTLTDPWGCTPDCLGVVTGWNCSQRVSTWSNCTEICGDGLIVGFETCDDGNQTDNRGCATNCRGLLSGWNCVGSNISFPSVCTEICDDGRIVGDEICDDQKLETDTSWGVDWGCTNDCRGVNLGWNCS